jgi:sulfur-oxidizing protein SoxY
MQNVAIKDRDLDRREFLKGAGLGALAITVLPLDAQATPEDVKGAIAKIIGDKTLKNDDRVNLVLPEIAENGGTVPLTVSVASPMSEADHVTAIHIFCDGNPAPDMASYFIGPYNGKAEIAMRIRLMQTQNVIAVAETSTGEVLAKQVQIKVTLGGCGG